MFGDFNPYTNVIHGDWFNPKGREHHTGAVYLNGDWFSEAATLDEVLKPAGNQPLWFGQADQENTTLWAQFKGVNPNEQLVEINVRQTVFYPAESGRNFITVRGFILRHAATTWASPTAEQIGLIGTHWSKGWIIENNVISHSACSGVSLGKYGDEWDNKSESADAYNRTIQRALTNGWNKATIGHHIVRNNTISHCEQAGIVGSLGGVFSQITGNHIHNIWTKRQFAGAEMAGIKIHAAIDVLIQNNWIHHAGRGLWMDWMAQGTRISGNLCYSNTTDDLFMEVDHGPFLVDNNLFLSGVSVRDWSGGGALAHNLMTGLIQCRPEKRTTPYHRAHSTALAGLSDIKGGDHRFYNNIFVSGTGGDGARKNSDGYGFGLWNYDASPLPLQTGGNIYYNGARPHAKEPDAVLAPVDPQVRFVTDGEGVFLHASFGPEVNSVATARVTTKRLGKTAVSRLAFENPDGSRLVIDTDYFGIKRDRVNPGVGPFENLGSGEIKLRLKMAVP
jgi:hypothetical protein